MSEQSPDSVRFTLNGTRHELTRGQVEERLAGISPETVYTHAVQINGTWFPVMQAFEVALRVPRASFNSHTARCHLTSLDCEVRGDIVARTDPASAKTSQAGAAPEWFGEADVQAAIVAFLSDTSWRIISTANTASKERGIDVVAARDGETTGIEVKGFPSRGYADSARANETKPTSPSTQAGHWFAEAVLAAMRYARNTPAGAV